MKWGHDDLQHDLAQTRKGVREIVAERLSIGRMGSGGQMDVFAMKPSWANPNPVVYEVKVTRQDFRGDTQAGKYRRYLPYCRRLYFACPSGLLKKEDVPEGMGLTVRGENGWHVVKAPKVRSVSAPDFNEIVFSLMLKVHPDGFTPPTRIERIRALMEAEEIHKAGRELPEKFRGLAYRIQAIEREIQTARASLCNALGVDPADNSEDLYSLARKVCERVPAAAVAWPREMEATLNNTRAIFNQAKRIEERLLEMKAGSILAPREVGA